MAALTRCQIIEPPDENIRGAEPPSYTAKWLLETDEIVPASLARILGQASATEPIPQHGAPFEWSASPSGATFADPGAYALDIVTRSVDVSDFPTLFECDVTWRPPNRQNDEFPDVAGGLNDPLQRPAAYTISYNSVSYQTTRAPEVLDLALGTLSAEREMQNSAGDPFPAATIQEDNPVITIYKNIASPAQMLLFSEIWANTVNNGPFSIFGRTINKHYAKVGRFELGGELTWRNVTYYRMATNIEISRRPFYTRHFNQGERYLTSSSTNARKTDDAGLEIPGPYPLRADAGFEGQLATAASQYNDKTYLVPYESDVAALLSNLD